MSHSSEETKEMGSDQADKHSLTSQLANHSEVLTKKNNYVFPEEYFKAMTVGEWVKVIS
jgi:hypothetical protein